MRTPRIPYSAKEMAWLEANFRMVACEFAAAFNKRFHRNVTARQLNGLRKRKGWRVGRELARAWQRGRSKAYSDAEIVWLEANSTMPIGDWTRAFNAKFKRNVSTDTLHALRQRRKWKTGRTGRYVKGQTPANKGKRCPPGVGGRHPNARKTQFKKGGVPPNTKHLGHERVTRDGYVEISIAETNPHTCYERRYVQKHKYLWEQKHGRVPAGHVLKCLDGNLLNTDPSNWELISRAVLGILNRKWNGLDYEKAPAELKPAILALAKLKHAKRTRERAPEGSNGRR